MTTVDEFVRECVTEIVAKAAGPGMSGYLPLDLPEDDTVGIDRNEDREGYETAVKEIAKLVEEQCAALGVIAQYTPPKDYLPYMDLSYNSNDSFVFFVESV